MTRRTHMLTLAIAVMSAAGAFFLSTSQAATHSVTLEAESGTTAGTAVVSAASNASAGNVVRFGSQASSDDRRSIKGQPLYVLHHPDWATRPQEAYGQQVGRWYGDWTPSLTTAVSAHVGDAAVAGQLPLLVVYNIPFRDCGSFSNGGAKSSAEYRQWIDAFAGAIGSRKAIIILEPDALVMSDCLNGSIQSARLADLSYATTALRDRTGASVYIDAGHSNWRSPADMASLLQRVSIGKATGFSLNVSNFQFSANAVAYGEQISQLLEQQGIGGARYVIDTGRNGKGPAPVSDLSWCNPPGRGLGKRPTTNTDIGAHNDAYLYIKTMGESDGECGRGEPPAGHWFPEYMQSLIQNAVY